MVEELMLITMEYGELSNKFLPTKQRMFHEIPEIDTNYIVVQSSYGGFLAKYTPRNLGEIVVGEGSRYSVFMDRFNPEEDYQDIIENMKCEMVQKLEQEASKLTELANKLKGAGL